LIGAVDFCVVRFELLWIGVVVVAPDGTIGVQRARLEYDAACGITDDNVQPRSTRPGR